MSEKQLIVSLIFILTYSLIVSEKIHRVTATIVGVCLILIFSGIKAQTLFDYVDFNVIGLLLGMMIMVNILKETGVIQYAAIYAIKICGGNPLLLMFAFSTLIALISTFLNNVTTVLLVGPVMLAACEALNLHPLPFIFSAIFASNIGGTATLIGDPPNILIGSAAGLTFNDFLFNLGPITLIVYISAIVVVFLMYRKRFKEQKHIKERATLFEASKVRVDWATTKKACIVFLLVLIAFTIHHIIKLEPSIVALSGAGILLLLTNPPMEKIIKEIDWMTILFFSGLFMLVGALEHLKIIELVADKLAHVMQHHKSLIPFILLWCSGAVSAVVDNVPYTAAMIPLLKDIIRQTHISGNAVWWALALGACLGGNATLVGSSTNLVMVGLGEKSGVKITFNKYLRAGLIVTVVSLLASHIYIWWRY